MKLATTNDAVLAWRDALGAERVINAEAALCEVATATFATNRTVVAVVRPRTLDDVRIAVRIAGRHGVPLYPTSGGRNWGLGSRVPAADRCAVLDLSDLDRIVAFDDVLGYVVVEPGVTFRQLSRYLLERGGRWIAAVTGGPADASVLANALERGDGVGRLGDRAAHVCNLQVVMADGSLLHTGAGAGQAAHLAHSAAGPSLEGLFFQSNFGIVTRLTVWLAPRPEHISPFLGRIANRRALPPLIDALRELLFSGVLAGHEVSLWNAVKMLARQAHRRQVSRAELDASSYPWFVSGALSVADAEVNRAACRRLEAALRPVTETFEFADGSNAELAESVFYGVPTDDNVRSAYWAKPGEWPDKPDPDGDRCGVIWFCPAVPLVGESFAEAMRRLETAAGRYGFDANIGCSLASPRVARVFLALTYDRDVPGADERAQSAHDEAAQILAELGCFPYRLGIHSMDRMPRSHDSTTAWISILKSTVDARHTIAPGRYEAAPRGPTAGRMKSEFDCVATYGMSRILPRVPQAADVADACLSTCFRFSNSTSTSFS